MEAEAVYILGDGIISLLKKKNDLNSIKTSRGGGCSLKQPPHGALLFPQGCSSCAQVVQGMRVSRWQILSKAGLELARWPQSLLTVLRVCSLSLEFALRPATPAGQSFPYSRADRNESRGAFSSVCTLGGKSARFYTFMVFKPCFQGEKVMSNASFFNHP